MPHGREGSFASTVPAGSPRHDRAAIRAAFVAALLFVLVALPAASTLRPPQAAAATLLTGSQSCGSGWQPGFTGWQLNSAYSGIRAGVGHAKPYLCSNPQTGDQPVSMAWTMLHNSGGCANCRLAQSGLARYLTWGTGSFFFYECADQTAATPPTYCQETNGQTICACIREFGSVPNPLTRSDYDQYKTTWSAGEVKVAISPTGDPGATSHSKTLYMRWTPNELEAFGEVHNERTQTVGTTASHEYFKNLDYRYGGTWYAAHLDSGNWVPYGEANGGSLYGKTQKYQVNGGPYDNFYLWDSRY